MFKFINGEPVLIASYKTSPNIGIIKYWGKWHEEEIIPYNVNCGVTLSTNELQTITTVYLKQGNNDELILNDKPTELSARIKHILSLFRKQFPIIKQNLLSQQQQINIDEFKVTIRSKNFFPSGSGLASSSSGLAALSLCLAEIISPGNPFGVKDFDVRYISRIGSGSACRTLFGDFVLFPGVSDIKNPLSLEEESKRCLPFQIQNSSWVRKEASILILQDQYQGEKDVLSSKGMKLTATTSELFQDRVQKYSLNHIQVIIECLEKKNYNGLMEIIMKDSNQFHAVCMDTYPPLFYMNTFSMTIIKIVHLFNQLSPIHVGYTFDAGAHAVLFVHNNILSYFLKTLNEIYKFNQSILNEKCIEILKLPDSKFNEELVKNFSKCEIISPSSVILTSIGDGPEKLDEDPFQEKYL